jgi:hypothetical protein
VSAPAGPKTQTDLAGALMLGVVDGRVAPASRYNPNTEGHRSRVLVQRSRDGPYIYICCAGVATLVEIRRRLRPQVGRTKDADNLLVIHHGESLRALAAGPDGPRLLAPYLV